MKLTLAPLSALLFLLFAGTSSATLPETTMSPVTDTYHDVPIVDDYRWLEDWSDPEVKAWSDTQNGHARNYLDKLPSVDEIRNRVTAIMEAASSSYYSPVWRKGMLFAMKHQPPKQQDFLVVMASADDPDGARVLVDPNELDPTHSTTIDWYRPSPDGKLAAVSMSAAGSESGDVHIYRTETGDELSREVIPRVNGGTAGGDLAWTPDGSGFFYTRYPRAGERPETDMDFYQQVYFHRLGTDEKDDIYELGKNFSRIVEIILETDNASGLVLATVQYGDSGRFSHYIRNLDGKWHQLTGYDDQIVQAAFGPGSSLYLISRVAAPRGKILQLDLDPTVMEASSLDRAKVVVPEGKDTIVSNFYGAPTVVAVESGLYVTYQLGGPSELRVFDLDGRPRESPRQLPVSSASSPTPIGDGEILFRNASYLEPAAWFRFDPKTQATVPTGLVTESPVDFADSEVVREWAVSKDGTRVPVNIIRPKGIELDGSNPVLLTGYGGYGLSLTPYFSAVRRVWVEQGGVYAIANLRGGGEFGEEWHAQGRLTQKQNVFDDFAAAMQHMIDAGYTTPERLAIMGGSNGGLLMGAAMTQHPDLPRVVVSYVGIYDMLRVELSPNGQFNIPEFGTVKDPDQFRALHAYSPYHQVKDGTLYPATLFLTGANDPRVDPMQSRKMTARLQAATVGEAPILLRTSSDTGHGGGTPLSERIAQSTDVHSFLFKQLGVDYKPVRPF